MLSTSRSIKLIFKFRTWIPNASQKKVLIHLFIYLKKTLLGHAGARNCKFLEKVTVTDVACKGDSNWKQYAVHAPDVPVRKIAEFNLNKEELMKDPPVQEMPVQSLITKPCPNDIIAAAKSGCKTITVEGVAWGGGGQGVNR